jgi:hypothetical protein
MPTDPFLVVRHLVGSQAGDLEVSAERANMAIAH